MLKKSLLALAIIVAVLIVVIALRPAEFRVTRAAVIPGGPGLIFPHANDLRLWQAWSPWAKLDPQCRVTFDGPSAGVGAAFAWSGNNEVGVGRMAIVESRTGERVRYQLDFEKPFAGHSLAELTFQPDPGGTRVTWTMTGTNNFIAKAFGLVIDCDKMIGGQFEQGLANLKAVVEATAKQP